MLARKCLTEVSGIRVFSLQKGEFADIGRDWTLKLKYNDVPLDSFWIWLTRQHIKNIKLKKPQQYIYVSWDSLTKPT